MYIGHVGAALGAMFVGVIATIAVIASVLAKLSNVYRRNCQARGLDDPGGQSRAAQG